MARPVTGNTAHNLGPDYWQETSDAAAAAKPQLVHPSEVADEHSAIADVSPQQENAPISAGSSQSGLPAAALTDTLNRSALQAIMSGAPQAPRDESAIKDIFAKGAATVMCADSVGGTGTATKAAGLHISSVIADLCTRSTCTARISTSRTARRR